MTDNPRLIVYYNIIILTMSCLTLSLHFTFFHNMMRVLFRFLTVLLCYVVSTFCYIILLPLLLVADSNRTEEIYTVTFGKQEVIISSCVAAAVLFLALLVIVLSQYEVRLWIKVKLLHKLHKPGEYD